MRRARLAAACAAILTALLLQATLVAPLTTSVPASLPAVLVVAVGLVDGPGVGMSFGFVCGLAADLGSEHPAGILALCWLGAGLLAGLIADRRSLIANALVAGAVCALAAGLASVLVTLVDRDGASLWLAVHALLTAAAVDGLLALAVVPLVRALLRSETLRVSHPAPAELTADRHRAALTADQRRAEPAGQTHRG